MSKRIPIRHRNTKNLSRPSLSSRLRAYLACVSVQVVARAQHLRHTGSECPCAAYYISSTLTQPPGVKTLLKRILADCSRFFLLHSLWHHFYGLNLNFLPQPPLHQRQALRPRKKRHLHQPPQDPQIVLFLFRRSLIARRISTAGWARSPIE